MLSSVFFTVNLISGRITCTLGFYVKSGWGVYKSEWKELNAFTQGFMKGRRHNNNKLTSIPVFQIRTLYRERRVGSTSVEHFDLLLDYIDSSLNPVVSSEVWLLDAVTFRQRLKNWLFIVVWFPFSIPVKSRILRNGRFCFLLWNQRLPYVPQLSSCHVMKL